MDGWTDKLFLKDSWSVIPVRIWQKGHAPWKEMALHQSEVHPLHQCEAVPVLNRQPEITLSAFQSPLLHRTIIANYF